MNEIKIVNRLYILLNKKYIYYNVVIRLIVILCLRKYLIYNLKKKIKEDSYICEDEGEVVELGFL